MELPKKAPPTVPKDLSRKERPPRFRGFDFAIRWAQARWAEDQIRSAICAAPGYVAIPYGRSQVGPEDPEKLKEYWKKFAHAEEGAKRPDVLVLTSGAFGRCQEAKKDVLADPTIVPEDDLRPIVKDSVCGVECEFSLWKSRLEPDNGLTIPLRKTRFTAASIWVKEEDLKGLDSWCVKYSKPLVVAHCFYDDCYALHYQSLRPVFQELRRKRSREREREVTRRTGVAMRRQPYPDATTGVSIIKRVFQVHKCAAIRFGEVRGQPNCTLQLREQPNGKLVPYLRFEGANLDLTKSGIDLLGSLR